MTEKGGILKMTDAGFMRELVARGFVRGSALADRFGAIADRLEKIDAETLGWVAAWPVDGDGEIDSVIRWDNRAEAEAYVRAAQEIDPMFCIGRVIRDD